MFDTSFRRSKLYFTVLETLRISRDWIEDAFLLWQRLYEQWKKEIEPTQAFSMEDCHAIETG